MGYSAFVGDLRDQVSFPLEGRKENVRLLLSTVINPPQVHISLSQHCGVGSVESQFGK